MIYLSIELVNVPELRDSYIADWLMISIYLNCASFLFFPGVQLKYPTWKLWKIVFFEMIFLFLYAVFNHTRPCVTLQLLIQLIFLCVMDPRRLRQRMLTSLAFNVCPLAQQLSEEKWVFQFFSSMDSSW